MADDPRCSFMGLPDEMLLAVLRFLDALSLLKIQLTCKKLRELVQDDTALKYAIALPAAGMCDGSPGDASILEGKKSLEENTEARKECKWTTQLIISFTGNVLGARGGVVGISKDVGQHRKLCFHRLPSTTRRVPMRSWTLAFSIIYDFVQFDPLQDLLLLCQVNPNGDDPSRARFTFNVRSLLSGDPHPLSSAGAAFEQVIVSGSIIERSISIHGDLVAFSTYDAAFFGAPELFVLSWKTGALKLHLSLPKREEIIIPSWTRYMSWLQSKER